MPRTQQVAALPWRQGEAGLEILLVSTRTTKRWVIPKGWTMDGKADHEAAVIEAFEEAGVRGEAELTSVGRYGYLKILKSGKPRHLNVNVFAVAVDEVLEDWPERGQRQRQWVLPQQALGLIGEPELLPVIAAFAKREGVAVTQMKTEASFFAVMNKWWHSLWAGR
jgi:8-oxo-dGTP pyrophosphatase MutT (NUDIX family)